MFVPRPGVTPLSEPGVVWLLPHEPSSSLPRKVDAAIADLVRRLGVPAEQVTTEVVRDGSRVRVEASWTPPE